MPTVPVYNLPQVQARGLPDVRLSAAGATPEAFGAGVGRAMQGLGATLGQAGDALARRAGLDQDRDNEAAVKELDVEFNAALRKLQFDPETGFYSKRGRAALDAWGGAAREVDELRQTMASRLENPEQKRLFGDLAVRRADSALDGMSRHAAQERRTWLDQASEARIADAANDGAAFFNDTGRINQAVVVIRNEILDQAERGGWDTAVTRWKLEKAQSDLHKSVIANMMVADPLRAKAYYDGVRDRILGGDQDGIERALKGGVTTKTAQGIADSIIGGTGPAAVARAVANEATKQSVDPTLALTTAQLESTMGAAPDKPGNPHRGVFQLGPDEWAMHGGGADPSDRGAQVTAGIAALKKAQAAATKALGRDAQPWEVYLTHQQGVAGGPALLKADPNAKAADVLAPFYKGGGAVAAITGNGGTADMTAGAFTAMWRQRYAGAESRATVPAATAPGVKPSLSGWLEQARGITDPDVRAHVESLLNTEHNRRESAARETEQTNRNEVWALALHPSITTVADIPPAKWAGLSGETQRSVMTFLEKKAQGKPVPHTEENQAEYYRLVGMSSSDPAGFADLDLGGYILKLPQAQWQDLVNKQGAINRKDAAEEAKAASVTRAMTLLRPELEAAGLKLGGAKRSEDEKGRVALYQGQLTESLSAFQTENKRRPTEAETLEIGRRLLVAGRLPRDWWFDRGTRLFEAEAAGRSDFYVKAGDIPAAEASKARAGFREATGRDPSDAELVELYRRKMGLGK